MTGKKSSKQRTELEFVRVYPFYAQTEKMAGYSFKVTVCTSAPMRSKLGMTVDLLTLNSIAAKVLVDSEFKEQSLQSFLQKKYGQLSKLLAIKKIKLRSVEFSECRGLTLRFAGADIQTIRHDFAADDDGLLFAVTSHFDGRNKLKKLIIKNLKADIEEHFIL